MSRLSRRQFSRSRQATSWIASPYARRLRVESLEDRRLLSITVDTLVDEADGSIVDGDISLRDAIALAPAGETIDFSVTGTIDLTLGQLTIGQNLTVTGPGANNLTINAGGSSRVMRVTGTTTTNISGLTLTGGQADQGGGLRNYSPASTTLTDVVVTGNTATTNGTDAGGGIWSNGNLTLADSTVSNNMAPNGTSSGGGIWNSNLLTITNSTLSGNSANSGGGGIFNSVLGTVTITNSTLSGNSAGSNGGGIWNNGGTTTITSSTISRNSANSWGAGIYHSFGTTTLSHTIVSGNSSATLGNEIRLQGGTVNLNNFNLIGDSSQTTAQALFGVGAGATDILATSNGTNPTALGSILDATLANNGGPTLTHALVPASPAINAGNPAIASPPTNDQRGSGFPRIMFDRVDIGAYEFNDVTIPGGGLVVSTLDDTFDGIYTTNNLSLREATLLANVNPGADNITLDASLSGGTINLSLGMLTLSDDVTLTGLGADQLTIDAGGSSRVMLVAGTTTANISGLTLTGGQSDRGGGLRNTATATTTLSDVVITGNTATATAVDAGGGIWNTGHLTITGSTISGNTASAASGDGGGIFTGNPNSNLIITNTTITGNSAGDDGGGLRAWNNPAVTISHSTITGNTVNGNGGGIYSSNNAVTTVGHSIISGNSAGGLGNEIHLQSGTLNLNNYNLIGDSSQTTAQALNGVAAGATDILATSDGTTPTALGSILDTTLTYNGGPTPTHALLPGSPAIDAGNPAIAFPPANDQRGAPFERQNGTIDIGAYEEQSLNLVVDTLTDESDGDYSASDLSLREALELTNANPGADTVSFDASLSDGTINLSLGMLTLSDDATLTGLGADQLTIDAGGSSRVMRVTDTTTANISGLTLTGGLTDRGGGLRNFGTTTLTGVVVTGNMATTSSTDAGGGIWSNANLTLVDSTLSNNKAPNGLGTGGGIWNSNQLTITTSTISGNSANSGGGGILNGGSVTVTNSRLSGNSAIFSGGGIFNTGSVTITNSTLSGNSTNSKGGGIWSSNQLTITNSTLSGNSTSILGGGIYSSGGTTAVANSTLSGNSASRGGGIYSYGGNLDTLTVTNSTLSVNSASSQGGGILTYGMETTLNNTIVANSTSGGDLAALSGGTFSGTDNLIEDGSGGAVATVTGDPMLGPLADNGGPTLTLALLPGSPALDAGNLGIVFDANAFDQRGMPFARVAQGVLTGSPLPLRIDIGAYEAQIPPSADFDSDGDVDGRDFLSWQRGFGKANAVRADGNSDDDTDVDISDLAAWQVSYGDTGLLPPPVVANEGATAAVVDLALAWESVYSVEEGEEFALLESGPIDSVIESIAVDVVAKPTRSGEFCEGTSINELDQQQQELWLSDEMLERVFG
ncbi:choice-of-anchor Q domain-containing protein [Bythopirellula goksoeyrii]|uniref:Probable pectate lyase C n=1 Tax=Bythopirellula goksoeyrii TaxID=1400387 RepID=A0A5B9QDC0_9BACT|nr:choice-of-anchor Q domain-containing protein [Bythopirellula goksoeyrii]QEG36894.1 hypothetical protein Pr1d_42330 [Bythopirellula goksoeyrii]